MMLVNFEKAFFPTEEDKLKQQELLHRLQQRNIDFWLDIGLSVDETKKLIQIEDAEQDNLHPYQEWTSRRSLIESGIVNIDQVKAELKMLNTPKSKEEI